MEESKKYKKRPPCLLDDCFAISKKKTKCTILEPVSSEDGEVWNENEECPFYKPDPKGNVKRKIEKDCYKYTQKKIKDIERQISNLNNELKLAKKELNKMKIDGN